MNTYYEWGDKIRDVLAEGYHAIDSAAALENEREARKIVAKLDSARRGHAGRLPRGRARAQLKRPKSAGWPSRSIQTWRMAISS